jgi:hypothetical protein
MSRPPSVFGTKSWSSLEPELEGVGDALPEGAIEGEVDGQGQSLSLDALADTLTQLNASPSRIFSIALIRPSSMVGCRAIP